MRPAESGNPRQDIALLPQRQGRELDSGGPALRLGVKGGHGLRRQVLADAIGEQGGDLGRCETEFSGVQLLELASSAEARQRERRLCTADEHDVRRMWHMRDQERKVPMNGGMLSGQHVVIIQDEGHRLRCCLEGVQEHTRGVVRKIRLRRGGMR